MKKILQGFHKSFGSDHCKYFGALSLFGGVVLLFMPLILPIWKSEGKMMAIIFVALIAIVFACICFEASSEKYGDEAISRNETEQAAISEEDQVKERLQVARDLYEKRLITEEEYEMKKKDILKDL